MLLDVGRGLGGSACLRSLALVLKKDVNQHYQHQELTLPSAATLYRYRISIDLCSMMFCRETLLAASGLFALHVRLDASPQFGKDYLNAEADVIRVAEGPRLEEPIPDFIARHMHSRMLVGQVMGARATSTVHKTLKLAHMLQLESESLSVTLSPASKI